MPQRGTEKRQKAHAILHKLASFFFFFFFFGRAWFFLVTIKKKNLCILISPYLFSNSLWQVYAYGASIYLNLIIEENSSKEMSSV